MKKKKCTMCGKSKPLTHAEFATEREKIDSRGYVEKSRWCSQCRQCRRDQSKARLAKRTDKQRFETYLKQKHNSLLLKYGITLEWYKKQFAKQNNKCAICEVAFPNTLTFNGWTKYGAKRMRWDINKSTPRNAHPNTGSKHNVGALYVDHHHKTGKARGLLCRNCNLAYGLMGESTKNIRSLLAYDLQYKGV